MHVHTYGLNCRFRLPRRFAIACACTPASVSTRGGIKTSRRNHYGISCCRSRRGYNPHLQDTNNHYIRGKKMEIDWNPPQTEDRQTNAKIYGLNPCTPPPVSSRLAYLHDQYHDQDTKLALKLEDVIQTPAGERGSVGGGRAGGGGG